MQTGDIVLLHTEPPHIASVSGGCFICEDGSIMTGTPVQVDVVSRALEMVKALESEVLKQNGAG